MLSHDTKAVLIQYWKDLGSPCALALSKAVERDRWDIVDTILGSFDQRKWMSVERHRLARCAIDIIRKADYLPIDRDKGEACIESFLLAESMCRATNLRFWKVDVNHVDIDLKWYKFLRKTKRIVSRILGPIPDLSYIEGKFGPGANLRIPRTKSSIYEKLNTKYPTITRDCEVFYNSLPARLRDCWGSSDQLTYVEANQFHMVPKSYKTHRGICIEPLVNAYTQRFFGLHIKSRLRRIGIDIDVASNIHRELAKQSSISGELATIDMSMASDTISIGLVKALLPEEWYKVLDLCRSKHTDVSAVFEEYKHKFDEYGYRSPIIENEKFSSMGNGFTFELETVIFTAIARACGDNNARSFGDDLIVRSDRCTAVLDALVFCGFKPNVDKTFTTGTFRESCGGDFRHGQDVKGETLKTEPACVQDWYDLHNRLFEMGKRHYLDLRRTLNVIRRQVPIRFRLSIPVSYGTGGFFDDNPKGKYDPYSQLTHYRTYRRIEYQTNKLWYEDYVEQVLLAGILLGGAEVGPLFGRRTRGVFKWDPPIVLRLGVGAD